MPFCKGVSSTLHLCNVQTVTTLMLASRCKAECITLQVMSGNGSSSNSEHLKEDERCISQSCACDAVSLYDHETSLKRSYDSFTHNVYNVLSLFVLSQELVLHISRYGTHSGGKCSDNSICIRYVNFDTQIYHIKENNTGFSSWIIDIIILSYTCNRSTCMAQ